MPNYFSARETLAESWRNSRSRPVPFTAGQCFGLTINENLSEVCLIGPDSAGTAEGPSAPSAGLVHATQEIEHV